MTDLNPGAGDGVWYDDSDPTRVKVIYQNVPDYGTTSNNTG